MGFLPQDAPGQLSAAQTAVTGTYAIVIVVAKDRSRLDLILSVLLTGLALGVVGIVALSALVIARAVKTGLSPVNEFAREVSGIDQPISRAGD